MLKITYILWNLCKKTFERISINKRGVAVKIPLGKKIDHKNVAGWEKKK